MVDSTVASPTNAVPYHQQDSTHWCGSACALMALHYLGVERAGGFPIEQKRVRMVAQHSSRSDPTYQWMSAPDGLTAALNYFCERSDVPLANKEGASRRWELVAADSEVELSRYIVWTLWRYRTPVIALVFGMQHWVVVGGCVTSRPPNGPDDTGYTIIGFHLSDPWPPIPRELARNDHFRHANRRDHTGSFIATDGCGSGWEGDPSSDATGGRGVALRYVAYTDWQLRDLSTPDRRRHSGYMTGVPPTLKLTTRPRKPEIAVRSRWVGKFLAICDPVETSLARQKEIDTGTQVEKWLKGLGAGLQGSANDPRSPQRPAGRLLRLVAPDEAVGAARNALSAHAALLGPGMKPQSASDTELFDGLEAEEPVLVERLDEPGMRMLEASYYIVPFTSVGGRQITVRVSARTPFRTERGEEQASEEQQFFLSISVLREAQGGIETRRALSLMNEESARGIIRGRALRGALGERVFVPKDYNREGTLVWKPCAESFDPLCPFYEFEVTPESSGDQPIYIYVRTFDGKVFTHLTEHYGGA